LSMNPRFRQVPRGYVNLSLFDSSKVALR
jgi:hypothetical protein